MLDSKFLSTLSLRRATLDKHDLGNFIPNFYPRSPCGERPRCNERHSKTTGYFYPRSPCGERHGTAGHALLAESDGTRKKALAGVLRFLSTLSLRRATSSTPAVRSQFMHFYPRSPCGERPVKWQFIRYINNFYPRSPCGERPIQTLILLMERLFLSTLSLRRATYDTYAKVLRVNISIHALLAESDSWQTCATDQQPNFYPRSPCGERQPLKALYMILSLFLSTLSLRRATDTSSLMQCQAKFLSTLSLRRATSSRVGWLQIVYYFYPRSPCGERQFKHLENRAQDLAFLSTLSLRRATVKLLLQLTTVLLFLSTLSLRRATPSFCFLWR